MPLLYEAGRGPTRGYGRQGTIVVAAVISGCLF